MRLIFLNMVIIAVCFLAILAYLYKTRNNDINQKDVLYNNNSAQNYLEVSGECIDYLQPDIITIDFTITTNESKANDSLNNAKNIYQDIEEKLTKLELQSYNLSVQTLNTTVKPKDSNFKKTASVLNDYETLVTSILTIKNNQDLLSVINLVSAYEHILINNINSMVSEDLVTDTKQACLIRSINNAKKKASGLANSLGKTLGDIIAVKEVDENKSYISSQSYNNKNMLKINDKEFRVYSNVRFSIN